MNLTLAILLLASQYELITVHFAAARNGCEGDDYKLLLAIRKAENGRWEKAFGIMDKRAYNLDLQAAFCACTIRNQHRRSGIQDVNDKFIESLGKRYCPVSAHPLNKNWTGNVRFWYNKPIRTK